MEQDRRKNYYKNLMRAKQRAKEKEMQNADDDENAEREELENY